MSDLNRVILMGHLGADPELRTSDGTSVLKLRLATNEAWVDKTSKELQQRVEWHDVTIFGARAEGLAKILHKGDCVVVEGGLRTSSWEKDGIKRFRTEVVAREVCLTGKRPGRDAGAGEADAGAEEGGATRARRAKPNGASAPAVLSQDIPF